MIRFFCFLVSITNDLYACCKSFFSFSCYSLSPLSNVLYAENEDNMLVMMGAGKFFAFTINTVIGLNNISDLTAVNNKIDNLTTLKLTHLAQVNSTPENLSTCIEDLKVGLKSTKIIIFTRPGVEPIDKPPERKYNLNDMICWLESAILACWVRTTGIANPALPDPLTQIP
jgi:hypothetical protein